MKSVHIFKTSQELLNSFADYFILTANQCFEKQDKFNVVLAGGHSPEKLYQLLSSDGYKNKIDWHKVNFFFGDERVVPENDPQRNSLMVKKSLFDPLRISDQQIFKIDTSLNPDVAAKKYADMIAAFFNKAPVRFNLVLLGLGDNSHTASLFPYTPVLAETTATVKAVFLKEQNTYRITLTAPMINQAEQIAFLVYGKEKANAVYHVLQDTRNTVLYPAQLIDPVNGDLHWFLDNDAASLLT